ncbi:MAG TPA: hypothetical protein VGQ59_00990 [Cyclobacteriaceae bacterium]|nr:hypothetical protein [Cyclobacteriaceae bacterium]
MPELSQKQKLFRDFLINKLGFINDDFLSKYVDYLEVVSPRFKFLGAQPKIWDEGLKQFRPAVENNYNTYIETENYFIPEKFNSIDLLMTEVKIKKENKIKNVYNPNDYISATDISNFTYCPISYAIAKTYALEKLESAQIGTLEHEKKRLLDYISTPVKDRKFTAEEEFVEYGNNPFLDESNKYFFEDLKNSEIIYSGHDKNSTDKKYFKSSKGKFVGQPDYIFRNKINNFNFVVEEKYQFVPKDPSSFYHNNYTEEEETKIQNKRNSNTFFENHKNQLKSYIFGLNDQNFKYGYLVYWKYEMEGGCQNVISCKVLKITNSDENRNSLVAKWEELRITKTNKGGEFLLENRNPAKCANCVTNILCGHKTGRFKSYSIPYSTNFLKVYYAEFPKDLKKNSDDS